MSGGRGSRCPGCRDVGRGAAQIASEKSWKPSAPARSAGRPMTVSLCGRPMWLDWAHTLLQGSLSSLVALWAGRAQLSIVVMRRVQTPWCASWQGRCTRVALCANSCASATYGTRITKQCRAAASGVVRAMHGLAGAGTSCSSEKQGRRARRRFARVSLQIGKKNIACDGDRTRGHE